MRVLVTGDRGYIGAVLVPWFIKHGHDIVGLDAGWYDGCDFGDGPSATPSRAGDVRDVTPADLDGFDAVVHLAAISNDPIGHLNPDATYSVNAWGAVPVARAAKSGGVERSLFSSSCSLYGAAGDAPVAEDAAFNPVTPYGESKVVAERELSALPDDTFSRRICETRRLTGHRRGCAPTLCVNNLTGTAITREAWSVARGMPKRSPCEGAPRPLTTWSHVCGDDAASSRQRRNTGRPCATIFSHAVTISVAFRFAPALL